MRILSLNDSCLTFSGNSSQIRDANHGKTMEAIRILGKRFDRTQPTYLVGYVNHMPSLNG